MEFLLDKVKVFIDRSGAYKKIKLLWSVTLNLQVTTIIGDLMKNRGTYTPDTDLVLSNVTSFKIDDKKFDLIDILEVYIESYLLKTFVMFPHMTTSFLIKILQQNFMPNEWWKHSPTTMDLLSSAV